MHDDVGEDSDAPCGDKTRCVQSLWPGGFRPGQHAVVLVTAVKPAVHAAAGEDAPGSTAQIDALYVLPDRQGQRMGRCGAPAPLRMSFHTAEP